MTLAEEKQQLIAEIEAITDPSLLQLLRQIVIPSSTATFLTSADQKSAIQEAREQVRAGKTLTNEAANEAVRKWLEK